MSLKSQSDFLTEWRKEIEARDLRRVQELGLSSLEELYAIQRAEAEKQRREEEAERVRKFRHGVLKSIGPRFTDDVARGLVDGAGLADTVAHLTVREWLASSKPTLVLSGGTGTGKTVAAMRAILEADSFQFLRAIRIGAHYERWSSDREDDVEPIRFGVALLVVDDLGQEPIDDRRVMPAIEEVLDQRQSERTRTLITTNLSADQLRSRYSERIVSRLRQNATVKILGASDMRVRHG